MNNTFYDPHTFYLAHHGIVGMKWGKRNGPPYPLNASTHNRIVKRGKKVGTVNSKNDKEDKKPKVYHQDEYVCDVTGHMKDKNGKNKEVNLVVYKNADMFKKDDASNKKYCEKLYNDIKKDFPKLHKQFSDSMIGQMEIVNKHYLNKNFDEKSAIDFINNSTPHIGYYPDSDGDTIELIISDAEGTYITTYDVRKDKNGNNVYEYSGWDYGYL